MIKRRIKIPSDSANPTAYFFTKFRPPFGVWLVLFLENNLCMALLKDINQKKKNAVKEKRGLSKNLTNVLWSLTVFCFLFLALEFSAVRLLSWNGLNVESQRQRPQSPGWSQTERKVAWIDLIWCTCNRSFLKSHSIFNVFVESLNPVESTIWMYLFFS